VRLAAPSASGRRLWISARCVQRHDVVAVAWCQVVYGQGSARSPHLNRPARDPADPGLFDHHGRSPADTTNDHLTRDPSSRVATCRTGPCPPLYTERMGVRWGFSQAGRAMGPLGKRVIGRHGHLR
jgi:hypothetical protein